MGSMGQMTYDTWKERSNKGFGASLQNESSTIERDM